MDSRRGLRRGLTGCLLFILVFGAVGVGIGHPVSPSAGKVSLSPERVVSSSGHPAQHVVSPRPVFRVDKVEAQDEEAEPTGDEEQEGGRSVIGDWWGLGGNAEEAPYMGLVELGVVILGIGLGGYMLAKRSAPVPAQYRRYLLPVHEWSMLLGTALTAPHFFAVEEWEGLGFAVGVLLAVEVVSGLYGYYLHRHVIRLDRGNEAPAILSLVVALSKEALFSRWRWIHRSLTGFTAIVLILHIVTAIGG